MVGHKKGTVIVLGSCHLAVFGIRSELVERMVLDGYEVIVSFPRGTLGDGGYDIQKECDKYGCRYIETTFSRRGVNPIQELKLLRQYIRIIKEERPAAVLGFTVKCDIYGGIACRFLRVPFIANITGLGKGLDNGGIITFITKALYKTALKSAQCVFFQNTKDRQYFVDNRIGSGNKVLLPGSGVNLDRFLPLPYPDGEKTVFLYTSRVMRSKGIEQYLDAARALHSDTVEFHICGFCEEDYRDILAQEERRGVIRYHGQVKDVREYIAACSCLVSPSFHPEGIANVLLEAAASARPIITTDRVGCRETVEDGVTGYLVKERDSKDLIGKIRTFLGLSNEERRKMGLKGREKIAGEFDRQVVVDVYMKELEKAAEK